MQIRLTCYSLSTFYDTRCPNISLAAVQILRCKTNWESMGARRRTKTATYTGMIVVPLGILLGWISCSGGAPQLKRLITATSLFYLTERPQFTATRRKKARRGPDSERITHLGNQNGTFTGVYRPLGLLFPGGSSTSAHVAPHTDLYSRSHSLMHAVAVPKGVLVLLPLYIQCSTSSFNVSFMQAGGACAHL